MTDNKNMRVLIFVVLILTACSKGTPFRLSKNPSFLIAGQSNSVSPAQEHEPYWSQTGMVSINDIYQSDVPTIRTQNNPSSSGIAWIYLGDTLNRPVTFYNVGQGNTSSRKWREYLYLRILERLQSEHYDAILWVQGESDVLEGLTEAEIVNNLKFIINKSKEIDPEIVWFIAINSSRKAPPDNPVTLAQAAIIENGLAFHGPNLDVIRKNPEWMEEVGDEFVGEGLREHGLLWYEILKNYF
jgi:hypothetical protein